MQSIINLIMTIVTVLSLQHGLPKIYNFVRYEALKKVSQGLPGFSSPIVTRVSAI
ncbi:MAG: hypothetical protein HOE90_21370 [Bacteriovoracaceae bacterium]|nr:hypothetical protein [Bacteriovoracaceae bacterium]